MSQLERRGSSGSMSERSFRDPSPNRGPTGPDLSDAPPVPAIPKNLSAAAPARAVRRAASVDAPAVRVASPPPNLANGRGSSLGPVVGPPPQRRSGQGMTGLGSVQELTGGERSHSRGSVNFSYPTSNRAMSPYARRRLTYPTSLSGQNAANQKQNLLYDPNTRSFRPEAELLFYEQYIRDAAERPVKKKKKVTTAGSHLAEGSVGGRPKGTAVDAIHAAAMAAAKPVEITKTPAQAPQPQPQVKPPPILEAVDASQPGPETSAPPIETTPKKKKKKKKVVVPQPAAPESSVASDTGSDFSERPLSSNARAVTTLAKKPSIVREDREREEEEDYTSKVLGRQAALARLESGPEDRTVSPSPLPRSAVGKGHGRVTAAASTSFAESRQPTRSVSQPPLAAPATSTFSAEPDAAADGRSSSASRGGRVQSVSPTRTAHFLSTPDNPNLAVRHQPPARSISPRKSALKNASSPRGISPIGSLVGGYSKAMSDTSEASALSDDRSLSIPRKKAVRVSFDDQGPVVLGPADSPVAPSPQSKRGWFSNMGRSKKKEATSAMEDDDDVVMKPRPALPSFGSVREKKSRDVEDRPLVRPADSVEPVQVARVTPAPSIFTTADGEPIDYPLGTSSDHQIGAVLAQEQATAKNEANISKSREPLPPEVTTVEGNGYASDSSSAYDVEQPSTTASPPREDSVERGPIDGHAETYRELASPVSAKNEPEISTPRINGTTPQLSITQATPTLEDSKSKTEFMHMPGGFQDSFDYGVDEGCQISIVEHRPTDLTPAELGIAEPSINDTHIPVVGSIVAENLHYHSILEETESDDESIYSDAAEDLSDLEGDGFMSLDAVVDSPMPAPKIPGLVITTPPESPTAKIGREIAHKESRASRRSSEPGLDEGWEKTQEYWSGLTVEKKRELERAARQVAKETSSEEESEEETGEESGEEEDAQPVTAQPASALKNNKITASSPTGPGHFYKATRTYQIAPGTKQGADGVPTMRPSMRAATTKTTPDEVHMRKSMRDGAGGSMRGSVRQSAAPVEPRGSLQKKYRPAMISQPEKPRDMSNGAAAAAIAPKLAKKPFAPLQRTGSDASDSSFKRTRPTSGFGMRSSMRGSHHMSMRPKSPEPVAPFSSRFSIRSLSPTGSAFRRPFSSTHSPPPIGMGRQTMRDRAYSSESNTPSLRSAAAETKSPLRAFGFGKKSEKKIKGRAAPKMTSRFADSSDEDDVRPAFRSRFADSSDEDEPVVAPIRRPMSALRSQPVRAIPRRTGAIDGDSSDLPDTDDEKQAIRKAARAAAIVTSASSTTTPGSASLSRSGSGRDFIGGNPSTMTTSISGPGSPGLRSEHKRRGSIMNILRRKKTEKDFQVRKSDAESPARRDTPLERSKADLEAIKKNDSDFSVNSPNVSPRPKLQKRNTGSYTNVNAGPEWNASSDWPLKKSTEDYDRPLTSDGLEVEQPANGSSRPDLGSRRMTATGLSAIDLPESPTKKKKKFGRLRKAFGLDH
jgi:serine/arginine repetitive matrix protein 2